jgi:hypothetical protein
MSSSIVRALKNIPKSIRQADIPDHSTALRSAARQAQYPSVLGNIFDSASYTVNPRTGGGLLMNGAPIEEVSTLLRRGNLKQFSTLVNGGPVSSQAEAAFRRTLNNVPDNTIRQLDELIAIQRFRHDDLDIPVPNGMTRQQLYDSMTPQARSKFESAMRKAKSLVGTAAVGFGVFAAIVLTIDFYQAILDATLNRRGCFYAIKIRNDVRSCRIIARTCWEPRESNCEGVPPPTDLKYNVAIMLMQALNGDSSLATDLENALSLPITEENVTRILSESALFQEALEFYNNTELTIISPCRTNPVFENEVPLCRACETTAEPSSLNSFDDVNFEENETLVCVPTGSVLETLIDLGFGLGADLLGGFGNKLSTSVSGNLWIIFIAIIVLIVVIAVFNLFKKNGK